MQFRRAKQKDIAKIIDLLNQVLDVHYNGRPDLFKENCRKYTDSELLEIIKDDNRPVFVAVNENDDVMGYVFCIFKQYIDDNILTDIKTLYIDDLCVDEKTRGNNIGKFLYDNIVEFAKENDFYNITLNVWACNEGARRFYEKCGLKEQKIGLEVIL